MRYGGRKAAIWQCSAVDAVIVPSHAMAAALMSYGVQSKLHVIPTGLILIDSALAVMADFEKDMASRWIVKFCCSWDDWRERRMFTF